MESDMQSKILEKSTTVTLQYDILEYVVHAYSSKRIVHQNGRENITNVDINGQQRSCNLRAWRLKV